MKTFNMDPPCANNTKIHIDNPAAASEFGNDLSKTLNYNNISKFSDVILLCIGTDRSTGDCMGPLIGTKITSSSQEFFKVYGTLDYPVHAGNIKNTLEEIYNISDNPFIIALDACLGSIDHVGCINIGTGSLRPGAGVNKDLPFIGDLHITGIVNVSGFMEYLVLQNTRLNLVMKIADTIVEGLKFCSNNLSQVKASTV
ncbi:MAG: spore protease YyaC [Clostridiales bacterium]|nr:spore protease YyaC [Clostridiales bacterium]MCF8022485.1 spore protease YyaC [Clostridiales bacterium]